MVDHLSLGNRDKIIIETHKAILPNLQNYLKMYRLRSNVIIKVVQNYRIFISLFKDPLSQVAENDTSFDSIIVTDPRSQYLGYRLLLRDSGDTDTDTAINVDDNSETNEIAYKKHLLENGIVEGPYLINKIPFEYNLDLLNYIDFKKGCYVGQELMARTKYKVINILYIRTFSFFLFIFLHICFNYMFYKIFLFLREL